MIGPRRYLRYIVQGHILLVLTDLAIQLYGVYALSAFSAACPSLSLPLIKMVLFWALAYDTIYLLVFLSIAFFSTKHLDQSRKNDLQAYMNLWRRRIEWVLLVYQT